MFSWFYQLLLVFIPCTEHFQREGSEYTYSYFTSTLSDPALPTLSCGGWLRSAPTPWMQAAVFVWQQEKSWMDSLHGCGPALMPWKGKSSLWGWGEGALPTRAVFQTRCPAVQIKRILIKLKLFETKIQPLQKPLISYGFLCIFLSLLNFSF